MHQDTNSHILGQTQLFPQDYTVPGRPPPLHTHFRWFLGTKALYLYPTIITGPATRSSQCQPAISESQTVTSPYAHEVCVSHSALLAQPWFTQSVSLEMMSGCRQTLVQTEMWH